MAAVPNDRVRVSGLTVTFGGNDVVSNVDLELRSGEIHALTGENGAGKSSLAKVIAGVYQPRLGSLEVDGRGVRFRNPREALQAGVALIHQEPLTFPDLDVTENIFAGNHLMKGPRIDWPACRHRAKELLATLGVDLDPRASVKGLSVAQRQLVELASALAHDAKVWIFDETTAPLTPKEVEELFVVMRKLRDQGCALVMVTHHLHEIFQVCDRITVLRDGKKVGELQTSDSDRREVIQLMVGRELDEERFAGKEPGDVLLEMFDLSGPGFQNVNLTVRKGEVVALAGLVGAGRTELARSLFGITTPSTGQIKLNATELRITSPKDAQSKGIALVPEDRIHDGLMMPQSIAFNLTMPNLGRLSRFGWIRESECRDSTSQFAAKLGLAFRGIDQAVSELSGGNQQKVVLGKWLATNPTLLILDEPTRGVDVGAKHQVHKMIRELANQGLGVLMISSDLKEVLTLSDRIAVMRGGRIVAEMPSDSATEEAIMLHATGEAAPV